MSLEAVVFDLFFTLVHPGTYPGGTGRAGWLADVLGVDRAAVKQRWDAFEPVLEAGRAPTDADGTGPELTWVRALAAELGVAVPATAWDAVAADWDMGQRAALLHPPLATLSALDALRGHGIRVGVLSNTHALEVRAWHRSPLAPRVDAVAFSHAIGALKPDPATYAHVLDRLGVPAASAAYVGDGSSDELAGARAAGFAMVVLAQDAPARLAPGDLPRLRAQADAAVSDVAEVVTLVQAARG